ncbi:hypothetical protein HY213_04835 [Candidatus Peregrinibacteria bacterium]|nr:hypothetical protein [Candidatus Peregrinibacteria bacterium]
MSEVELKSEDNEGGPVISLTNGEHATALRQELLQKYQTCVADLSDLRTRERYHPPEDPIFAPLRYRIALLGELLKEGKVGTHDLYAFFLEEDKLVYGDIFERACEEIASDAAMQEKR